VACHLHEIEQGAHTIPIGPLTKAEIDQFPIPLTFNNYSNSHSAFLKATKLPHFTRHDLRRSYATVMAEWTAPHVLDRLLAHTRGQISGVAAIYNRHAYLSEMREAVLTFERWITCPATAHTTAVAHGHERT
jgi:integrase